MRRPSSVGLADTFARKSAAVCSHLGRSAWDNFYGDSFARSPAIAERPARWRWRDGAVDGASAVQGYVVRLSAEGRERLKALVRAGKSPAQLLTRARILLKTDVSRPAKVGATARSRRRWTRASPMSLALGNNSSGGVRGDAEAQIQSELRPTADFRRGGGGETDRSDLLAGSRGLRPLEPAPARRESRRVEHRGESQRQHDRSDSKKNVLKPHRNRQWVIPPDANAGFVAAMEDVLETYQKPRDPDRPLVCLDETSKQLIVETRAPIPAKPGQPARHDYEYERNGVANLFMMFAPLEGWRHVKVTDRHAAVDYAQVLKELSDLHFPDADKIVLVQDNLSTHTTASLYAAFPAPEARRLANRFEWHYTPKHGSWLDMAESELAVLTSQCLSRRIPDKPTLEKEVTWQRHRNKHLQGRLAIHNRKRPGQAQEALSPIRMTRATSRWVDPPAAAANPARRSSRASWARPIAASAKYRSARSSRESPGRSPWRPAPTCPYC